MTARTLAARSLRRLACALALTAAFALSGIIITGPPPAHATGVIIVGPQAPHIP